MTIDFKGEIVDPFSPKSFDSKAVDLEKEFKKLDKGLVLNVIERTNKNKINYFDLYRNIH